jgi:hypothetical protein
MPEALAARQPAVAQRADPQRAAGYPDRQRAPLARGGIDRLQRSIGNRGMMQFLRSAHIQPKLTVGPVDDEYEREADRVADQVMRMPDPASAASAQRSTLRVQRKCVACEARKRQREPHISRKCASCEEAEEEHAVQAKFDAGGPGEASSELDAYIAGSRGGGAPLPSSTRAYFENRFGHDFGGVRVHTGARSVQAASEINALAFATGSDIHFASGRFQPGTPDGDRLLAHELTHTIQQTGGRERVQRRGPVVRPPVRAPAARLGGPTQQDNTLEGMMERARGRNYAERERFQMERPVATLQRGGRAPDFITEEGTRRHSWLGGPGGGGSVDYRVRKFHILDAIEYHASRASTEEDLEAIVNRFIPGVATGYAVTDVGARSRRQRGPFAGGTMIDYLDAPIIAEGLDPNGVQRIEVFEQAARRRAETVPALANSILISRTQRRRGCRLVPTEPSGDDPLSNLYCHAVTNSPYSYRIYIETSQGTATATQRWAEIDALRGNTWYECKCGYEALLTGAARGDGVARAKLDQLDHQVLNHLDIARTCGLEYRYIVSNDRVAEILRDRWFGNVTIEVREFEPCD